MGIPSIWGAMEPQILVVSGNHPILKGPKPDQYPLVTPKELGSAFLITGCTYKGTFGPESPFGHPGKLARRPLCQAEKNFAWWEGKQTRGNDAVQWGFKQQIMGIQSISKDERNSGANCSCGSMQLTMFPFSKSCSIDVEGCYRWYVILLRGQVEG